VPACHSLTPNQHLHLLSYSAVVPLAFLVDSCPLTIQREDPLFIHTQCSRPLPQQVIRDAGISNKATTILNSFVSDISITSSKSYPSICPINSVDHDIQISLRTPRNRPPHTKFKHQYLSSTPSHHATSKHQYDSSFPYILPVCHLVTTKFKLILPVHSGCRLITRNPDISTTYPIQFILATISSIQISAPSHHTKSRHQYDLSYPFLPSPPSRHAKFKLFLDTISSHEIQTSV
jgi:hypothetical protein